MKTKMERRNTDDLRSELMDAPDLTTFLAANEDNFSSASAVARLNEMLEKKGLSKAALRKLKRDLYGGAYGRWLAAQKAIRAAKAEAEQDAGHHATPQRTWWEEKALADRFICEAAVLVRVYKVLSES